MVEIKLEDFIRNTETIESYILFRKIEDWCEENLSRGSWQFNYSQKLCAYGVDIPGRILFKNAESAIAFKTYFSRCYK